MFIRTSNTIVVFCCCFVSLLGAQQHGYDPLPRSLKETGYPFIQNYSPEDYNAFYQNWGATQDSLGILYFANGDGVLTYDGVQWDLIELPNKGTVFSLDRAKNGTIYVGAHNELGYLKPQPNGKLEFISLLPFLHKKYHDFNIIRETFVVDGEVFFGADQMLFKWDGEGFLIWEFPETTRVSTFVMNDDIYLYDKEKGLLKLLNGTFTLIPDGAVFAQLGVRFIQALDDGEILVGSSKNLHLIIGESIEELRTDKPEFFEDNRVYRGVKLRDGTIAMGSLNKGILIIDKRGRQRAHIAGEDQMLSDQVLGLFQDESGLLWAGLQTGIAKIEYPSPFTFYDKMSNLPELVYDIARYKDSIYVGTPTGLYVMDYDKNGKSLARSLPDFGGSVFDLRVFRDQLLVGAYGLYVMSRQNPPVQILSESVHYLQESKIDTNRLFVGLAPGLTAMYYEDGKWLEERKFEQVTYSVHTIVEDAKGDLWLRTNDNTIARLSFANVEAAKRMRQPTHTVYGPEDGFPNDVGIPFLINDTLYFITTAGDAYYFKPSTNRFIHDKEFYKKLEIEAERAKVTHVDEVGNIWVITYEGNDKQDQLVALRNENAGYELRAMNEHRIINLRREGVFAELTDSILWYKARSEGLIRHHINRKLSNFELSPTTFINRVWFKNDSLLYAGHGSKNVFELPHKQNQLRFKFSSPFFYQETLNKFQFKLEGYDPEWSEWTMETQKDYTNIPEGDYTFKVRAKNIYGKVGVEDVYNFTILSPWYRSVWMYLLYTTFGVLAVLLISQWRSRQLQRKNLILEGIVKRRTEEISKKNKLLKYQTERLKEMDTMKTRLFANISHEFRTPLTLIKGPIEKLETTRENTLSTVNIKMIRRNANRLLNLVNQLLDLSKLDSGKLRLNLAEGDVFKCLRAAASAFSSHAASRNMDYQIKIPNSLLWATFDRDKLEKIIYNLLSNAFKFTPDEGRIILDVAHRSQRLKLKISDTGSGIAKDKLPHIFDRFFQVDDSYTREKAGSGIGLALTKELTELMGGTIYVESDVQKGTQFKVVIPLEEIQTRGTEHKVEEETVPFTNLDTPQKNKDKLLVKGRPKVLLIEDNNDMRHFIREQLEQRYNILEAVNGKEGLKMANKMFPELIVTDLMMPQMDGMSLCKKLKTSLSTSHIPVIMLTAKAGIENKLEGLETGADDYLTKPFNADELQIRVKNLIVQRQLLRERFSRNISLDPQEIAVSSLDEAFLQRTLALLEEKYSDSEFGVPQMQQSLAMGKTQLHTKIKALTNHPPGELLRNFRLQRAAQLLSSKAGNVSQIAYDVGFNSLSYFTRCFKAYYKVAPTSYTR